MPALRNPLSDHRLDRATSCRGAGGLSRPWRDRGAPPEWWSVGVALLLTTIGFSVSVVSARMLRVIVVRGSSATRERVELVRLEPPVRRDERTAVPPADAPRPLRRGPTRSVAPVTTPTTVPPAPFESVDSAGIAGDSTRGTRTADGSVPSASAAPPLAGPRAVVAASGLRFPGFANLDSAALDSVQRLRARHEAEAWRSWRMPREIVEAEWRRESERIAARAADKRPWTISVPRASGPVGVARAGAGVGVSIPLPLFASGPSRKQRMRDSAVHAGNLERLQRIFERARRDSIARAAARTP